MKNIHKHHYEWRAACPFKFGRQSPTSKNQIPTFRTPLRTSTLAPK